MALENGSSPWTCFGPTGSNPDRPRMLQGADRGWNLPLARAAVVTSHQRHDCLARSGKAVLPSFLSSGESLPGNGLVVDPAEEATSWSLMKRKPTPDQQGAAIKDGRIKHTRPLKHRWRTERILEEAVTLRRWSLPNFIIRGKPLRVFTPGRRTSAEATQVKACPVQVPGLWQDPDRATVLLLQGQAAALPALRRHARLHRQLAPHATGQVMGDTTEPIGSTFCFFLGTHQPCHLGRCDVPLLLNRNRLSKYRPIRRHPAPWFVDSSGFMCLRRWGRYPITPERYADEVRGWAQTVGAPAHVAVQDWLCEDDVLQATGLSIREHQERTVESYLVLRELAPELPWLPVLQGYSHDDYLRCLRLYAQCGVELRREPLVGLGSVCQRQATKTAAEIIEDLAGCGLRLHAFGFKISGLPATVRFLASSDSNNWSNVARWSAPLPGHKHRSCQGCLEFALLWRQKVLRYVAKGMNRSVQMRLFAGGGL